MLALTRSGSVCAGCHATSHARHGCRIGATGGTSGAVGICAASGAIGVLCAIGATTSGAYGTAGRGLVVVCTASGVVCSSASSSAIGVFTASGA